MMEKISFCVNQSYSIKHTVSNEIVQEFAQVSGDNNPIHVDEAYAKNSIFKGQVAHGMLSASYISAILGTKFPGNGTIYLGQNLKFVKPVYVGDTIEIVVTILEIGSKSKARLSTNVYNGTGDLVVEGEALVKLPE